MMNTDNLRRKFSAFLMQIESMMNTINRSGFAQLVRPLAEICAQIDADNENGG